MTASPAQTSLAQQRDRTEQYLRSDPTNKQLLIRAVELNLADGNTHGAQGHAKAALALFPDDPQIQVLNAHVLSAQHKWHEAAVMYAALLRKISDPGLAFSLANCQARQDDHQAAFDTLFPFAAHTELPAPSITLLVRALHHLGKFDQAIALADQHAERFTGDAAFLAAASLMFFDSGNMEKAISLSDAAFALGARPLESLVVDGSVALANADGDRAVTVFQEALTLNPGDGRSWAGVGEANLLKRDYAAARAPLEKAVKLMPKHLGSWHSLGWCHLLNQQLPLAEKAFRQALEIDRNFAETHGSLAVVSAMKGDRQKAEEGIERALRLDSASLSARLAQMLLNNRTADTDVLRSWAMRIIAGRKNMLGVSLTEMVERQLAEARK